MRRWHRWLAAADKDARSHLHGWLSSPLAVALRADDCRSGSATADAESGSSPRLVAGATGHPLSTVSEMLARHGHLLAAHLPNVLVNRCEWP